MARRIVLAVIVLLLFPTQLLAQQPQTANIVNASGEQIGTITLTQQDNGVVIQVEATGLEPGEHGIHIHETGLCEPDFSAAGGHFNPTGAEHGLNNPNGPHAGDLENMTVADDGTATYETISDRFNLGEGDTSLADADGSALIIHANADDQVTDPSGNSGDRVACAVLYAPTQAEEPTATPAPEEPTAAPEEPTATPAPDTGTAPPTLPETADFGFKSSAMFVVLLFALVLLISGSMLKPRRR